MKKASQILALLVIGFTVALFLMRSRPVLLRIPPDDTIRPRHYCLLNPFRDKAPENVAQTYLNKLREGRIEVVSPYVGESRYILEKEKEWPIQSWRVGNREDDADKSELMYWVKRGNGYSKGGYEEEVRFTIARSGSSWEVKSFGAVY
jgi:hypothetical protein